MGDDLKLIEGFQTGKFGSSLVADILSLPDMKFRPFANPAMGIAVRSCQFDFDCYENIDVAWYILNGVILGAIVYELTRKWALAGLLSILIYVFSRFSLYFIVQIYGIMENACITFVLLYSYAVARYIRDRKQAWFWSALLFAILATASHERLIVLVFPLYLLPLLVLGKKDRIKIIPIDAVVTLFPIAFIVLRVFVVHIPVLLGTGGTLVTKTFSIRSFIGYMVKGLANLVSFNAIDSNLGGANFRDAGLAGFLYPVLICIALLIVTGSFLKIEGWKSIINDRENHINLVLLLIILCLIAGGSVTIRQDSAG